MVSADTVKIIEALRKGIPPNGAVRYFTVGRDSEIAELRRLLQDRNAGALFLNGNFGAGKTHLIRFIREEALKQKYAVSVVNLDSKNGIRFNRMDQILAAICRNIEFPPEFAYADMEKKYLHKKQTQYEILAYASLTRNYINKAEVSFIFSVSEGKSADNDSSYKKDDYAGCWQVLRGIHAGLPRVGLKGLVILFDEFEDILTNLKNIKFQDKAFQNMFRFCGGEYGKTFFAVTPEFVDKCYRRYASLDTYTLQNKYVFSYEKFRAIPQFEMAPLEMASLITLGKKIVHLHGLAYGWDTSKYYSDSVLSDWLKKADIRVADRTRQSITTLIRELDALLP
ncbi:MAG: ATP-binding protein [Spirochaetaceae bacterium]|jgi:hypothetical protein|nr:ATP-binding protein [Spirochaetaceae bacterium]